MSGTQREKTGEDNLYDIKSGTITSRSGFFCRSFIYLHVLQWVRRQHSIPAPTW